MATLEAAQTNTNATANDNTENADLGSSGERFNAPIQPLVQPRTDAPEPTGYYRLSNAATTAFTAVKATAMQQTIGHPLSFVRILMQMGYEPLPAIRGKTLFGKEALYYPNVLRYMKYVYTVDGFFGLYRGFGCSILSKAAFICTTTKVNEILGPVEPRGSENQTTPEWNRCIQKILREVQLQSWGVLVSHPFHVMAIRCMGQFVGREKIYSSINIFQNFKEIYDQQGIGGFFVGLVPRWLLEVSSVIITNVIIYFLKTQLSSAKETASLYEFVATFIAQTVTYPLHVVSTVTAINRSGLRVGGLPITPIYANWHEAYRHLKKTEQLKRGSGLFNRSVLGTSGLSALGTRIPNA